MLTSAEVEGAVITGLEAASVVVAEIVRTEVMFCTRVHKTTSLFAHVAPKTAFFFHGLFQTRSMESSTSIFPMQNVWFISRSSHQD